MWLDVADLKPWWVCGRWVRFYVCSRNSTMSWIITCRCVQWPQALIHVCFVYLLPCSVDVSEVQTHFDMCFLASFRSGRNFKITWIKHITCLELFLGIYVYVCLGQYINNIDEKESGLSQRKYPSNVRVDMAFSSWIPWITSSHWCIPRWTRGRFSRRVQEYLWWLYHP